MAETKLSVAFCHFPYAGNGASSKEHPDIRQWEVETVLKMRSDSRIKDFVSRDFCDTPITMTRNRAMREAKKAGIDLLLMIDSDQSPDKHRGASWYRPFWDVAFDCLYKNYHKGPRLIFAPYCGPPDDDCGENVFVFQWATNGSRGHETQFSLEAYTREQAALMSGIQEAAAGPTGLILMDTRLLDLIEPSGLPKREVLELVKSGQMNVDDAMWALKEGYCHYEWTNAYAEEKASTEDVTLTRDISMAGIETLGYNPVFCAWDSWIGHWKPWNVGKPRIYSADRVAETLKRAVRQNHRENEVCVDLGMRIDSGIPAEFLHPPAGWKRNGHAATERTDATGRVTEGRWFAHGHAPKEHCDALVDLVRSEAYRKSAIAANGSRPKTLRILEVGSWLGTTAIAMADASNMAVVHCVDTWEGSPTDCTRRCAEIAVEEDGDDAPYKEFLKRIGQRLDKTIFPWKGTSAAMAAKHWEPFDIIFFDAEHTYEALKAQIVEWWPYLADDGIAVGHDFATKGYPGVEQAVQELFRDKFRLFGWHPQGCLWLVEKRDHLEGIGHAEALQPAEVA